jgi:hypothetical protein
MARLRVYHFRCHRRVHVDADLGGFEPGKRTRHCGDLTLSWITYKLERPLLRAPSLENMADEGACGKPPSMSLNRRPSWRPGEQEAR